jgi:hypothetical protein
VRAHERAARAHDRAARQHDAAAAVYARQGNGAAAARERTAGVPDREAAADLQIDAPQLQHEACGRQLHPKLGQP